MTSANKNMTQQRTATIPAETARAELLAQLNRYTRTDALRTFAPENYRGGPCPGFKLWVGPEAIGAELLVSLNRAADAKIDQSKDEVTRQTINRRKDEAHEKNRQRVEVFVNGLKEKDLLFLRVSAFRPALQDTAGQSHEGSPRGRKEIDLLRRTGAIETTRNARYYGSVAQDSGNTYVAVPANKIVSFDGLQEHARSFDKEIRLAVALRHFEEGGNPASSDPMELKERMNFAFSEAAKGIDRSERATLRKEFERAVSLLSQNHYAVARYNAPVYREPKLVF